MIDIKDSKGNIVVTIPINEGATRRYELMGEDSITLPFTLTEPIIFRVGDWCEINLGTNYAPVNGKYIVTERQQPTYNTTTGGWNYELKIEAWYKIWRNHICKYIPYSDIDEGCQEIAWTLTSPLEGHLTVVLRNIAALGLIRYENETVTYVTDDTVNEIKNTAKFISYNGTSVLDALNAVSEAWECEWWIEGNTIHFGRMEIGEQVEFSLKRNLSDMRASGNRSTFGTRAYIFGSKRNLPRSYRKGNGTLTINGVAETRLMLPLSWTNGISGGRSVNYIDSDWDKPGHTDDAMTVTETFLVADNVYPRSNSSVSSWRWHEVKKKDDDGVERVYRYFRFKDTAAERPVNPLVFSKDYILGEELHVKFMSGAMNGMEFAVTFNPEDKPEIVKNDDGTTAPNPEAQLWEIVVNENYGRPLPDDALHPSINDTFAIIGWDATKGNTEDENTVLSIYVEEAEKELLELGKKYIEKTKIAPETYNCYVMFSEFFDSKEKKWLPLYDKGQRVMLSNEFFFGSEGRDSRIIGYEIQLDIPYDNPVYIVGESVAKSRLGSLEGKLDNITRLTGNIVYTDSSGSSSSGTTTAADPTLKDDIQTMTAVGYIGKGITLRRGMTWEEIFRQMFLTVTQASLTGAITHGDDTRGNDVEYGTLKGHIDYTAIRNDAGAMETAYLDNNTAQKAVFSTEDSARRQTYSRNLNTTGTEAYTKKETYTMTVVYGKNDNYPTGLTLNNTITVNVRRKWFAGVVTEAPATSAAVRALTSSGLYTGSGKYNFQAAKGWHMIAICLPGNVTVKNLETEKKDGNYAGDRYWRLAGSVDVEGANGSKATEYSVYTFGPTPGDNDGFTFTFEV